MASDTFLTGVPELMEWGLQGRALSRRHRLTLRAASAPGLLALWSLAAGLVAVGQLFNPVFLPGPWLVLGAIGSRARSGRLWGHIAATLERVAVGFGTGAALALVLGLLARQIRPLRNAVEPVIELLRPIPPLAMLPLFIVWVGIGEASKVSFITYATFFPMFLTTVHAVG